MGEPVKIADLARDMIKLSGLEPDVDIDAEVKDVIKRIVPNYKCSNEVRIEAK